MGDPLNEIAAALGVLRMAAVEAEVAFLRAEVERLTAEEPDRAESQRDGWLVSLTAVTEIAEEDGDRWVGETSTADMRLLLDSHESLWAEVERLTAEAVPDGVVVIDGDRWRLVQLINTSDGDVNLYRLIPATEGTD